MLRPHAIVVNWVLIPIYSLGKVLRSPRVSFITLCYILLLLGRSLGFFLMPGMCHQGISPIYQDLTITMYSIQCLLLMLPHILLVSKLYFKHPNSVQRLLQQLLLIVFLPLSYRIAPGTHSRGIVQISNLLHAVFAYTKPGGNQRVQKCRVIQENPL